MAKNSIRDFSATASSNTDIQSVDIDENCAASGINNAIRELMADLADVNAGTVALTSPQMDSLTVTGDVGIGTTSPASFYSGANNLVVGGGSGGTGMSIYSGTTDAGRIYFADGTSGAARYAGYVEYSHDTNTMQFGTNGTTNATIDASGNVGIGITGSPAKKLHLTTTAPTTVSATNMMLEGGTNGYGAGVEFGSRTSAGGTLVAMAKITADGEAAFDTTASTQDAGLRFFTAEDGTLSERMRIDSSGNLTVAKTSTDISTRGVTVTYYGTIQPCTALANYSIFNKIASGTGKQIEFRSVNTAVGNITSTTSSTSYNTSSDYRLKENVTDITGATERLKQLNPVRFNFIADADTTVDGFLAHEVQDVVPEAITGTKDAMRDEEYEVTPAVLDDDGNEITPAVMGTRSVPDYQGIDQSKLVPLLVATIQELEARIAALETA